MTFGLRRNAAAWVVSLTGAACAAPPAPAAAPPPVPLASVAAAPPEGAAVEARLARVAMIHGGAGPWVVAGLRMGEYALRTLDLPRGSFDLEVLHYAPHEVQYSCIADGAAAATGASLGKLNLSLSDARPEETHTLYRRRSTGQVLDLRFTKAFAARYLDVPVARLADAGREVVLLRDPEIFEVVASGRP